MSYHTLIIVGYIGKDPEMHYTPAGQAVTNFTVATNRPHTSSGGEQVKETTWFRVSVWGKTAENCNQYLHKGSLVLVEGRLVCDPKTGSPRLYTRQDGSPGTAFEVSAHTVRFLSGHEEESAIENTGNEPDHQLEQESPL